MHHIMLIFHQIKIWKNQFKNITNHFSKPPNQKTKRKFDIYNESFTEKPDESFQRMINELKQKNSANENTTTQNDQTKTKH